MNNPSSIDSRMNHRAGAVLRGEHRGNALSKILPFLGPAFVASVAYMDPGNFATNISAGAKYGYLLLWVVLASNLMAILIQYLSAKLGIVTGHNLPENIRNHWPKWLVWPYWIQAELVAMATDLAEFLGAALAFQLLFGIPLLWGAVITGIITFAILGLQNRGFRPIEIAITVFVAIIGLAYLLQVLIAKPGADALLGFIPKLNGTDSLYLAVGIIGATVMPHVIYLHSALTQNRISAQSNQEKRNLLRLTRIDVLVALGIAGLINMSMLASAAAAFHGHTSKNVADLSIAYQTLTPLLGGLAASAFALALLASGISSSAVGTMAGQVVMQGFVGFKIPVALRRIITMLPAFAVILFGLDPTSTLVLSQVVLSFGIPFALVPLLVFTSSQKIMGTLANKPIINILGWLIAAIIVLLNLYLLAQAFHLL